MDDILSQPLSLPCGVSLPNRLGKAPMTEGLADERLRATEGHVRLYKLWSEGGAGLHITGNVQIDRRVLERPGNVAIDNNGGIEQLEAWAKAGTTAGNQLWMQISHAGRQSPFYVTSRPLAPSPIGVKLAGSFRTPRAITESEILDFTQRFAYVAGIAKQTGFTGVQVHGAHGYLLSSFLSPYTNRRNDQWGGSLENRARFLLNVVRGVRKEVGPDFPVSVKLNSSDFQKGGFSNEDCLQVVEWLNECGVDLLEISGGNYEQVALWGLDGEGDNANEEATALKRESTRKREAYFLEYAKEIRRVAKMPLMVSGGFRSRQAMRNAIESGDCDVIGLGRPLCTHPNFPKDLLEGRVEEAPRYEDSVQLGEGFWGLHSSSNLIRTMNTMGQQGFYYVNLLRMGAGQPVDTNMHPLAAMAKNLSNEIRTGRRIKPFQREVTSTKITPKQ
ncbi:MAG: NADH:flavin oxidoreductase/NADH oxidase family protein [Salinisphaeraceae bacterium]|nr:NADH:flavin oxidoreductase/NADH oxidase family protein [Salinisphaeraceae bacterium]